MFAQMRREIHHQAEQATNKTSSSHLTASAAGGVAAAGTAVAASSSTPLTPLPCPPDSFSLGRAGWTFLHTMSAYYPDQPSQQQQQRMASFITNFAQFYPCPPCAEHFQQHIEKNPPPTQTRNSLSLFLCRYHNDVNVRLGKPTFDCNRYDERWRDGPKEDAGYDCIEESSTNHS